MITRTISNSAPLIDKQIELHKSYRHSHSNFLSINKVILARYGLITAGILSNLRDKNEYWLNRPEKCLDGWFFHTLAEQSMILGLSEYQIRTHRKILIDDGIVITKMKGIPPKELYRINEDILHEIVGEHLRNYPLIFKGMFLKKLEECSSNVLRNNKEPIIKEPIIKEPISYTPCELKKQKLSIKNDLTHPLHFYHKEARYLSSIIQTKKNMRHSPQQLVRWAEDIKTLTNTNQVSLDRIHDVLEWYEQNIGLQYTPVVESGRSLRDKFLRLEEAVQRKNKPGNGKRKLEYSEESFSNPDNHTIYPKARSINIS